MEKRRVLSNIFLHWFLGPIRKPVEQSAMMLPTTYRAAKLRMPACVMLMSESVPCRVVVIV